MRFRPFIEQLESRRLLASDWQNPLRIRDVNGDGDVTALDVLQGINRINANLGPLPTRDSQSTDPYYDVDGDSAHTPLDILLVINAINNGPLLNVSLSNDTGTGPNASGDKLTRDIAIQGTIKGGAGQLSARLGPTGKWVDISSQLVNSDRFALTQEAILTLFPDSVLDGALDFYFAAKNTGTDDALADRVRFQFKADRQSPVLHPLGQIQMDRPDEIIVPVLETVGTVDVSKIGLSDVTAGENEPGSGQGEELPRIPLRVESARILEGGLKVALKVPPRGGSARYLVEFTKGSIADVAGNDIRLSALRANYLAPNVAALQFETAYYTPLGSTSKIQTVEYQFELPKNDRLVWGGDRSSGGATYNGLSEFEIVDATGTRVWSVKSGQRVNFNPSGSAGFFPQAIPLAAGVYRLRMIETTVPGSLFWLGLESHLTQLPMSLASANFPQPDRDSWVLHTHRIHLRSGENLYIDKADSSPSDSRNPLWRIFGPNGELKQWDSPERRLGFEAEVEGDYLVVLRDAPYSATRIPPPVYLGPGTDPTWNDPVAGPDDGTSSPDDGVIVDRGTLPDGRIDLDFVIGKEILNFTLEANAGDFFFLRSFKPIADLQVSVLDKNGSEETWNSSWFVRESGTYQIRFRSKQTNLHCEVYLTEKNQLPILQPGPTDVEMLPAGNAFRLTPSQNQVAILVPNSTWDVQSVDGTSRISGSSEILEFSMETRKEYVFRFSSKYDFSRAPVQLFYPTKVNRELQLDQPLTGRLDQFGDRQVIEVQLEAGYRYSFSDFPSDIPWRWLDAPHWLNQNQIGEFTPGKPVSWEVLQSGLYRFEVAHRLTNRADEAISFQLQLSRDALLLNSAPPLTGFGTALSGTASNANPVQPDVYQVQMPQGTQVYINVKQGDLNGLEYRWISPSGAFGFSSRFNAYVAPESGTYLFQVYYAPRLEDQPEYQLELLTPTLATTIELNALVDVPDTNSNSTRLFQTRVTEPTFVYSDIQSAVYTTPHQLRTSLSDPRMGSGIVRLDPMHVGWVPVYQPVPFSVRTFEPLAIGRSQSLGSTDRLRYGFYFDIAEKGEYSIDVSNLQGIGEINLLAPNGSMFRELRESYVFEPGRYHLLLDNGYRNTEQRSILVRPYSRTELPIQFGQTVTDKLVRFGQVNRYLIDLTAGQELFLSIQNLSTSIPPRWIDPDGESTQIANDITSLRIARSGRYTLEVSADVYRREASARKYSFAILDLANAQAVGLGESRVVLSPQSPFSLVRYMGQPGSDVRMLVDGQPTQLLTAPFSAKALSRVLALSQSRIAVTVPKDGNLFVLLTGHRPVQFKLESYLPRIARPQLGEWVELRSRYDLDEFVVKLEIPTDQVYLLEMSNGSLLYDSRGRWSFTNPVVRLLPGQYELRGLGDFAGRISSLTGVLPTFGVGQNFAANTTSAWQLEIPTSERYEFKLRDSSGRAIAGTTVSIFDSLGREKRGSPRVDLDAGRFWLKLDTDTLSNVQAGTQYTLELLPVQVLRQAGAIGQDLNVNLSASVLQEIIVTIPFLPKQKAVLDRLVLEAGVKLEYQRMGGSGWTPWSSNSLAAESFSSELQLRFTGSGSATIRLLDWANVAPLAVGRDQLVSLAIGEQRRVWRLELSVGSNIELNLGLFPSGARAYLASASNELLEEIVGPITFSSVNRKPVFLVVELRDPLTSPLAIRYDFIKS